jgi:hypothetical protein
MTADATAPHVLSIGDRSPIFAVFEKSGALVPAGTIPDELAPRLRTFAELLQGKDGVVRSLARSYLTAHLKEIGYADPGRIVDAALEAAGRRPDSSDHLRGFSDLEIMAHADPEYLLAGLLPKGGMVELVGRYGACKTFLLLDWAMHIAAGIEWQGRRTRRGPVLYVYAEGSMRSRVAAWRSAHQVEPDDTVGVTFIPGTVNLLDAAAVAAFAADVLAGKYGATEYVLIIVETLTRMTPGGNENSPETMSLVVAAFAALQRLTGACVTVSHHTPWDMEKQRPRGHTGLPDAADAVFLLENANGALTLTCQKMRDGEAPAPIHLKATPHDGALVIDAGPTPAARHAETDQRIIEVAMAQPGLSTNRLIGSGGRNRSELLGRVHALISSGLLVNTGTEKRPKWRHNPASVPSVPNGSNGSGTTVHSSVPTSLSLGSGTENRYPIPEQADRA